MPTKLALCLLLSCISLSANARDVQLLSPNGSCSAVQDEDADTETARAATDKRAAPAAAKTRAPARRGGDADANARPPRWHSFLPGMFR